MKKTVPTKSATACPALVGILSCELWVGQQKPKNQLTAGQNGASQIAGVREVKEEENSSARRSSGDGGEGFWPCGAAFFQDIGEEIDHYGDL